MTTEVYFVGHRTLLHSAMKPNAFTDHKHRLDYTIILVL